MSTWQAAIDASGRDATVALRLPSGEVVGRPAHKALRHNTELIATLDALADEFDLQVAGLAGLAVAIGPGSFTGLRSACAAGQGLALARPGLQLWAVPSADVMGHVALNQHPGRAVLAVLSWKRGMAWTQRWQADGAVALQAADRGLADVLAGCPEGAVVVGDLPEDVQGALADGALDWQPALRGDATDVLALAMAAPDRYACLPEQLQPCYPREAEAVTLWRQRHGTESAG